MFVQGLEGISSRPGRGRVRTGMGPHSREKNQETSQGGREPPNEEERTDHREESDNDQSRPALERAPACEKSGPDPKTAQQA